jgi:hypothetical protein
MTDILIRLRRPTIPESCKSTCSDAAAEIEKLRAEILDARHGGRPPECFWLETPAPRPGYLGGVPGAD